MNDFFFVTNIDIENWEGITPAWLLSQWPPLETGWYRLELLARIILS